MIRPMPPSSLVELSELSDFGIRLTPAPAVWEWLQAEVLADTGDIHNPDHAHLLDADIRVMWASSAFQKQGRTVLGQAEQIRMAWGEGSPGMNATPFRSTLTRAQVRDEYIAARDQVNAFNGEDSGSAYLTAMQPQRDRNLMLAGSGRCPVAGVAVSRAAAPTLARTLAVNVMIGLRSGLG